MPASHANLPFSFDTTMNIVCATDGNYLPHCVAMLKSLSVHNAEFCPNVFIIYHNTKREEIEKAFACLNEIYSSVSLLKASTSSLNEFPVSGHGSLAVYLKLVIPDILPAGIDKALFIDSDAVVINQLIDLWQTNLEGKSLAAVSEHRICSLDHGHEPGQYFNSGVMLIDLARWRNTEIISRGLDFARNNPHRLRHWDQDVLNNVFQGEWLTLQDRWNACPHLFGLNKAYDLSPENLTTSEQEAIHSPAIIHFAGGGALKPWHAGCQHPYRQHYLDAKAKTPWKSTPLLHAPPPVWKRASMRIMKKTRSIFNSGEML
jgi:lipopolysaccharide biosynthesis glycosyltransferase